MAPDSAGGATIEPFFEEIEGVRLECAWLTPSAGADPARPPIVMLHEGLGSLAMWKDFPAALAEAAGARVLVYSRYGYGRSTPLAAPFGVDYMHREALETLPRLLDRLEIDAPVLFGHSDGGSIALIHAGGAARPVAGIVLMAPHVFVEDLTVASIEQAKEVFETSDLVDKLGRYHDDPDRTFRGWNDIWLHPDFRAWNIEEHLPQVAAPALAIQGADDEYGTLAQIDAIERGVAAPVERLVLERCKHSPHRDRRDAVLEATAGFVAGL
ncbi:MAG: alpha/beta hydrolase [Marivibrio sp.]|uniref:alpha/beta fold hydrolase n=1 Tax=Marivibrio sp. TaxID=2039719 RepID=UPI0032ED0616